MLTRSSTASQSQPRSGNRTPTRTSPVSTPCQTPRHAPAGAYEARNSHAHGLPPVTASNPPSRRRSPTDPAYRYRPSLSRTVGNYDANASIALIGMRGAGMSTLAIMASSALGFRVLDADQYFYKATGLSRAAYQSAHGIATYRREELRLMRSMLFENPTEAVIVCGPGAVEGKGKQWLAKYAQAHPIIYVTRDPEEIRRHLRIRDVKTVKDLLRRAGPAYRSLSSFEFHNLSDTSLLPAAEVVAPSISPSPKSLALKNIEEDFLHLIYGITKRDDRNGQHKAHNSLTSLPPELRAFTYALTVPASVLGMMGNKFSDVDSMADAIELTISPHDFQHEGPMFNDSISDRISEMFYRAMRNFQLPIIFHILTDVPCSWKSGQQSAATGAMSEDDYFDLLHHGLRLSPEYICVDLECDNDRIRELVARKGQSKVIGSYHRPSNSRDDWDSPSRLDFVRRAQELGCDIVRLSQEAMSPADNFASQHFIHRTRSAERLRIPIIAYNTGHLGRMSCYTNSILTPATHPLLRTLAPTSIPSSMLTIREAQSALFQSLLLDPQYFVIYGNNVLKSLSPAMHNGAFELFGMPHRYEIFCRSSMNDLRGLMQDPNFGGASITAPFKREVTLLVDFMSREAKAIGAVNTILPLRSPNMDLLRDRNRSGPAAALFGENTDWIGIHSCVRRNLSPINAVKRRTTGLVLGAGGMARAAVYALIRLGVRTVFVHNRTISKAEELVRQFDGWMYRSDNQSRVQLQANDARSDVSPDRETTPTTLRLLESKANQWPDDANPPTIIVSCVATREVDGQCSADTSLPPAWFGSPTGGVVIELSYTPYETPLLKQVRDMGEQGWIAVDGLQVLPEQGMMQFELFTTRRAPSQLMRQRVTQAYERRLAEQQSRDQVS